LYTIEDYRSAIGEKVKHLDIGMLVLNAGFVKWGPFKDISDKEVEG
jgi:short-subunit dehydrogenase